MFVGKLDEAVVLLAVLDKVLAHLADERAARIGARFQRFGDLEDRVVDVLQLLFVNVRIVDPVDQQRAERVIVRHFQRLIMLVAKTFEEIHVDDRRTGRDDAVDHVGTQQLGIKVHAPAGAGRTRNDEKDRAIRILKHLVVDASRSRQVARGEAHLAHLVDDRPCVETGDVDMLDLRRQKLGLALGVDLGGSHFISPNSSPRRRPWPPMGRATDLQGRPWLADTYENIPFVGLVLPRR